MKPADDAERLRCLDRDLGRPVRAKAERRIIDGVERTRRRCVAPGRDGKAIPAAVLCWVVSTLRYLQPPRL